MIKVSVFSEEKAWSKRLKNKDIFFKKICRAFPKKYQFSNKKVLFSLLLSNNKNIKKLNKNFRNKNKSTDILSFPFNKKIKLPKNKNMYLGDIIISYNYLDKPKSQDLELFKQKTIKIFIHGFLHLLGFDHKKNKDYFKMLREENFIYKHVKSKIN
ncbi:rRNA maturation RNase YbeY [Candidatus Pelagibacter sp. RS39]|uniref:rRNA maturation RNase YbeY n=1 Tax=Candidatus Pelagibacter sp. RS39 TaxID=1977864 RepID=UPI000A1488DE|nr:rRNA maturation RNase YbeY [Candidatus Pelagibacter sp. RS39]ARJ47334.1 rRNA maturation RNase YbeY [Candidatus Pelagibacter sp. RS39]